MSARTDLRGGYQATGIPTATFAEALTEADYYPKVGQCPGILNGPQCRDTGTPARF